MFGLFVLAGLGMALFAFVVSFVIPMDATRLRVGMFVAVVGFAVFGMFYSIRFFILVSRGRGDARSK
jgi:hypothetical protein